MKKSLILFLFFYFLQQVAAQFNDLGHLSANLTIDQNTIQLPALNHFSIELRTIHEDPNGQKDFYIGPNPVSEKLMVNSTKEIQKLRIYSIYGDWIQSIPFENESHIDVSNLATGHYVLETMFTNGKATVSRFFKM